MENRERPPSLQNKQYGKNEAFAGCVSSKCKIGKEINVEIAQFLNCKTNC